MKKVKVKKDDSERWMLSYLDFITLLMIFFLVMYAISNVDSEKYKALSSSLKEGFINRGENILGVSEDMGVAIEEMVDTEENNTASSVVSEEDILENTKSKIDNLINQSDLKDDVTTNIQDKGLVITFNNSVLFSSADASIKPDAYSKLLSISKILNSLDNYIRVEGHTDNISINNDKYSSNWQLSSMRASNVVEFLVEYGRISPDRLSSVGYGEYRPLKDNSTEYGRLLNRRVDILVLNSKFADSEKINN